MSTLSPTSQEPRSWWARTGAIGLVVAAAIGAADHFAAPAGAQPEPDVEVVSVTDLGDPLDVPAVGGDPAIDDGASVIAFVSEQEGIGRVAIRDRLAGTTELVAEPASSHPALSGDGCTLAYLVGVPADPVEGGSPSGTELRVLPRCDTTAGAPASLLVVTVDGIEPAAAPALSADGSVLIWSTGTTIRRFERFTNLAGDVIYVENEEFDPVGAAVAAGVLADGPVVTGPTVDTSADAAVVAFVAGPGDVAYQPDPPDVLVWSDDPLDDQPPAIELASVPGPADDGTPPATGSTRPALSADGAILLFESGDPGLAAVGAMPEAIAPFVVVYERGMGTGILAENASRPAISADGHHALYERGGALWVTRWTDGIPFSAIVSGPLSLPGGGAVTTTSGAVVSEHGNAIAFDAAGGPGLTADGRFHGDTHVWLLWQAQDVSGAIVNLGSFDVPGSRSGTATVTNWAGGGFAVDGVTADAPLTILATDCEGVLQPGAACTVDVRADLVEFGAIESAIRLTGGSPRIEVTVPVIATGVDPTASTTTTTTDPASSTSSTTSTTSSTSTTTTLPRVTIPIRPTFPTVPRTTVPRTTPRTTAPRPTVPRSTVPRTTAPRTTTPTTTLPVPVVFNPTSFEFAPTIVGAGRRTASVDLFNPSQEAVSVLGFVVDPVGGNSFTVDGVACQAVALAPGGLCTVGLEFAPVEEGVNAATVTASFSDGAQAVLVLSGVGAPPPVLTVVPDVAGHGQVVAVEGGGFPAGGTVRLIWDGGNLDRLVAVDAGGGFVETVLVPRTAEGGPTQLVVEGQPDVFADVVADLLVSRAGGADVIVFGGLGPSLAR